MREDVVLQMDIVKMLSKIKLILRSSVVDLAQVKF